MDILYHENFRRQLWTYSQNVEHTSGKTAGGSICLCPEADDLLYRKTSDQKRIIDYSDDHERSRKIFRQLIREAIEAKQLPQVRWKREPYYWRSGSADGINLRPGQLDGRADCPEAVRLGDDCVHGLIVGRTGAGKSVLLNNLLVSLMDEYAPWELSLYIVDMKKVEFGAFMSRGQEAPHVKACAATSEVRYIISILRTLERVMQMRQNFFTAIGYKKLEDFRKDPEHASLAMPRVLVVVDEFQQLFLNAVGKEESEILRLISSITRLGRATGFHLLFASQEMSGTGISGLLGNFKLRMALPCDAPVSSEILGNSAAAELEKGWVLVNSVGGDESRNRKYRVPLADKPKPSEETVSEENQYLQGHLSFVRKKAVRSGFMKEQRQKYYQEDLQYDIQLLEKRILPVIRKLRARKLEEQGKYLEVFALGNTVCYSTEPVDLENICIERGRGQNLMAIASDSGDLVYLQKLLVDNIAFSPLCESAVKPELLCFAFDPVLTSYYPIEEDKCLKEAGIRPRMLDESDLPGFIRDLQVRKILFRYLMLPDRLLPAAEYFDRASKELIQSLDKCQVMGEPLEAYGTTVLEALRQEMLKELKKEELPQDSPEALSRLLERIQAKSGKGDAELIRKAEQEKQKQRRSFGQVSSFQSRFAGKRQAAVTAQPDPQAADSERAAPGPEKKTVEAADPEKAAQVEAGRTLLLTLLRHYLACREGTGIQDQLPLQVVMISNASMSELLSAASPRKDIRVLQDDLIPQSTSFQTLFLYFLSEPGEGSLRKGFNYYFVCGNREADYFYCRMNYTSKMPGSIVVDCRIHNKNVECSFKKFRWLPAEPAADTLDLSGLSDLYGTEEDSPEPEECTEDEPDRAWQEDAGEETEEETAQPQEESAADALLDFF